MLAKPRLENIAKHEMDQVEKMNIKFEQQKNEFKK